MTDARPAPDRAAPAPVADGVYRLGDRLVCWWMVVEKGAAVVVDAGLPRQYGQLERLLDALGLPVTAVEAVVATHGHIDHLACIPKIRAAAGADVYLPSGDRALAASRPGLDPGVVRHSLNPSGLRTALSYAAQGVLGAKPVVDAIDLADGEVLDLPGRLRFLHAPGHTVGGGMFLHGDGDVLFSGDVLVTLDPFSGRTGPRTLPAFDNVDHGQALASLDLVARSGASVLLPGHGEPWRGDPAEAAALAVAASSAG